MKQLFLLCAVSFLSACSTVVSLEQPGRHPDLQAGAALSGDWTVEKGEVLMEHQGGGQMKVAIKPPRAGVVPPPPFTVFLRRSDDHAYASLRNPDDPEMPGYLFLHYRHREDGHIEAWIPNAVFFRTAIEQGRLKGEISGSRFDRLVMVTASQQELNDFIAGALAEEIWDMDSPIGMRVPGTN